MTGHCESCVTVLCLLFHEGCNPFEESFLMTGLPVSGGDRVGDTMYAALIIEPGVQARHFIVRQKAHSLKNDNTTGRVMR